MNLPRIINIKNGYVLDLSPERKQDAMNNTRYSYCAALHPDYTGRPILSDPSSLISMGVCDARSATAHTPILAGLFAKSAYNAAGSGSLVARYTDIGFYPFLANYADSDIPFETRFKSINGYPSGILEWTFKRTHEETTYYISALAFTWQEVLYLIFNTQNLPDFRMAMEFINYTPNAGHDLTASYEEVAEQGTIWVQDHMSGLFAALACSPMDEYQVDSISINPTLELDTSKTSVSHTHAWVALGSSDISVNQQLVFTISMGKTKTAVQDAVVTGLSNWESALIEAESYWADLFTGMNTVWYCPDELKYRGYMAINQLAALQYKGFISSGMPNWYGNWIRDTGWIIKSLCRVRPDLAKTLLLWFQGCVMKGTNCFDMDRVIGAAGLGLNTDNAAVFLMAVGEYWKYTRDIESLKIIQTQINDLFDYVDTNYDAVHQHVLALHAHDYWDDYVPEINTSLVKFESMIDVLWIKALELMVPVYRELGDQVKYQRCMDIAAGLQSSLEDYRRADGGLEYAIKTDDSMYNSVLALPGNIFAAWLLEDESCRLWLKKRNTLAALGTRGSNLNWAAVFSNYAAGYIQKEHAWFPHIPILAILAMKEGDYQPVRVILDSFKFGAIPEYVKTSKEYDFDLVHGSHAWSFGWSYSAIIELLNEFLVGG